jgi:hypothetical protein
MEFQKAVLIIALVILVIAVIIISAILGESEKNKKWPPEEGSCPPYYKMGLAVIDDPNSIACVQQDPARHIGRAKDEEFCRTLRLINSPDNLVTQRFTPSPMNGKPLNRAQKKKWAEECKLKWDGYN